MSTEPIVEEAAGLCVEVAADGAQALAAFQRSAEGYYDVILMDIRMPVMNGIDSAKAIRAGLCALGTLKALDEGKPVHRQVQPVIPRVQKQQVIVFSPAKIHAVQAAKRAYAVIAVYEKIAFPQGIVPVQPLKRSARQAF